MSFDPINGSKIIFKNYVNYLRTTFFINDEEYMKKFEEQLHHNSYLAHGPYVDVTESFETGKCISDLISEGILSSDYNSLNSEILPIERPLYKHQERSISLISKNKNAIITTGTGSGKTESFLLPVINYLMREKEVGSLCSGVRALIIYPMNALANDQIKRLRLILANYPYITFGTYTGETEEDNNRAYGKYRKEFKSEPLPNEKISRQQIKESPPHILITNYAMLEYLMLRPKDNSLFSGENGKTWKFIILDEAHTYSGATGIEVSMLLKRLTARLSSNDIKFILTSATLGTSENDNPAILNFAKTLCSNENFDESCIIRARRVKLKPVENLRSYPQNCYYEIGKYSLDQENAEAIYCEIKKYNADIQFSSDVNGMIFDFLLTDELFYMIKGVLKDTSLTVKQIAKKVETDENTVIEFISLASKARKNGTELFDGRYHYFLRALSGAYISLSPYKEIFLEPYYENNGHPIYKFSVCRSCGQIYIFGNQLYDEESKMDYLSPKIKDDEYGQCFILTDKFLDDVESNTYKLCSNCGAISRVDNVKGKFCKCGKSFINYIVDTEKTEKSEIKHCMCCDAASVSGSILRNFFVGQDAATSVVATSLYSVLPSVSISAVKSKYEKNDDEFDFGFDDIDTEINETLKTPITKQYLIFSDSRQQAAYFASYFDGTYHNILRRRILIDVLKNNKKRYTDGVSVTRLKDDLFAAFEKYNIFEKDEREKEAVKTILYEMVSTDRHTLEGLGVIWFEYNGNIPELKVFKNGETRNVIRALADNFRKECCIEYDKMYSLTPFDKEYFQYFNYDRGFILNQADKNKYDCCWTSGKIQNTRTNFLKRISVCIGDEEWSTQKCNKFLELVWQRYFKPSLHTSDNLSYRMNIDSFTVYSAYSKKKNQYICRTCGKITVNNVNGICPTFRCDGTLRLFDISEYQDNHYMKMYSELDIYDLKIKEHTAQLSTEKAKEYQEQFVNKEINILSCSTTFEMGVDVGDLETVMLKNMPPTPANYIQRVGRAGRRRDSAAYALTFCRTSSHDTNYFNNPVDMIKGHIQPPYFKILNEKIVRRHVYAVFLSDFFKQHSEAFKDARTLMLTDNYNKLIAYAVLKPRTLICLIQKSTPSPLHYKIEEWLDYLVSENGELTNAYYSLKNDIDNLQTAYKKAKEKMDSNQSAFFEAKRIHGEIETLKSENIISFLSRNNIIPKYGFPVDCVELKTTDNNYKKTPLRLQRDMKIAVSEYAPDSQIIADGMMYTSRYIAKPPNNNHDWKIYDYGVCNNLSCGNTNIKIHSFDTDKSMWECAFCNDRVTLKGAFIIPEFGFISEINPEKAYTKQPKKNYSGNVFYIGNRNNEQNIKRKKYNINGEEIDLLSSVNDELLIMSVSDFYVCPVCGYAKKVSNPYAITKKTENDTHITPYGKKCINRTMRLYSLGHTFRTDVVRLDFYKELDKNTKLSVLYALLEGISRYLKIERTDIDGCVQSIMTEKGYCTSFIIFDNVPGGAGHVSRICELDNNDFQNILCSSFNVVNKCTCGGEKRDTACYNCLWNYSNQRIHNSLNRGMAIDFLKIYV